MEEWEKENIESWEKYETRSKEESEYEAVNYVRLKILNLFKFIRTNDFHKLTYINMGLYDVRVYLNRKQKPQSKSSLIFDFTSLNSKFGSHKGMQQLFENGLIEEDDPLYEEVMEKFRYADEILKANKVMITYQLKNRVGQFWQNMDDFNSPYLLFILNELVKENK